MEIQTVNHSEIKEWAREHNAMPTLINHPQARNDKIGIRLNFPGNLDDRWISDNDPMSQISWDYFFKIFEDRGLIFVYNTDTQAKDPSLWYRFEVRKNANEA